MRRAPLPDPMPTKDDLQGMYNFLRQRLMYVDESDKAFKERRALLNDIDAKIDQNTLHNPNDK